MKSPEELRKQADRYRQLAVHLTDRRTITAITGLAEEYETAATAMEQRQRTRERAYWIWEERGRPQGCEVAHWAAAEAELAAEEDHAAKTLSDC